MPCLLGLDVGSSSIKASLLDVETGATMAAATSPNTELPIVAPRPGWAEQDPASWWEHAANATREVLATADVGASEVKAVGIAYQMHGLVCVDRAGEALRPAIIWCDSRAVEIGNAAAAALGDEVCGQRLLNSPGNFTASKLKWVKDNEPEIFAAIDTVMLPGDYLAMRLTGTAATTASGLSEGVLWDFQADGPATMLLDHYGIAHDLLAPLVPTFGVQGELTAEAAQTFGLATGTPVSYRGGDQPNNALSLGVLQPGEVAATAGTSGVVYGVTDQRACDPQSRVNTFVHLNHRAEAPRYGVLLCINGTGILNSWLKREIVGTSLSYKQMDALAAEAPVGSEGLVLLPYGNGAERTLGNRELGGTWANINFNIHGRSHYLRAAQEGIVFAMKYGLDVMAGAGVAINNVRAGHGNMFISPVFQQAFATTAGAMLELYDCDGAQGAARGAGLGAGIFADEAAAMVGLERKQVVEPDATQAQAYADAYGAWRGVLDRLL
ncbi:MAG: xylulokinase [Planctomycetota bacterium]